MTLPADLGPAGFLPCSDLKGWSAGKWDCGGHSGNLILMKRQGFSALGDQSGPHRGPFQEEAWGPFLLRNLPPPRTKGAASLPGIPEPRPSPSSPHLLWPVASALAVHGRHWPMPPHPGPSMPWNPPAPGSPPRATALPLLEHRGCLQGNPSALPPGPTPRTRLWKGIPHRRGRGSTVGEEGDVCQSQGCLRQSRVSRGVRMRAGSLPRRLGLLVGWAGPRISTCENLGPPSALRRGAEGGGV